MTPLEHLRAGQLAGSQRLALACGLTEFPREIFELADTLEILDLSGNALRELPADLPRLHRLRILFCSGNQFTELPAVLGQCPSLSMIGFKANQIRHVPGAALPPALRWLILTDNQIEELPAASGVVHSGYEYAMLEIAHGHGLEALGQHLSESVGRMLSCQPEPAQTP